MHYLKAVLYIVLCKFYQKLAVSKKVEKKRNKQTKKNRPNAIYLMKDQSSIFFKLVSFQGFSQRTIKWFKHLLETRKICHSCLRNIVSVVSLYNCCI